MAIIYYPANAVTFVRRVSGGQMIEQYIGVAPDQVIVLSGSIVGAAMDFITASYALSYQISMSNSDFSTTSSFSINTAGGMTVLKAQVFS